ncbi:hypothetical protein SpCBS45565_g01728 [Spizellomyces sp. 'palustris']|nr:hypothetical protein SpCBS45565_g01728 [Spizellomyces sp. 'palustris']
MFRVPFPNPELGADVANELSHRACHAEYGTPSEQGHEKTSAGRKRRGRRDRMRRFRRSHATDTPLHLGAFNFQASDSESSTLNQSSGDENMRTKRDEMNRVLIRQERQRRRNDDLNDAELYALSPFLSSEPNQVQRNSRRSSATSVSTGSSFRGRRVSASHGKLIKPVPEALGVAKLKGHDGPNEPMVEKKYHTGDTHFPNLRPEAETADKPSTDRCISFYVTPQNVYDLTPRDVECRAQLMRELVSWYFYSRWTSPALQGGEERATAPEHPAKMCLPSFKMERLSPLMETEDENQDGFDVFAGIGTQGFTFALSKVDRRTLRPNVAQVTTPPTQIPNDSGTPAPSPAVVNPFRGTYKHRLRRVSLTPDLEIAQMGSSATNIPVMADFGKVKTNAAPLIKPRDRAKRHRGPSKFGKAWGTSLGPWVDHDPDLCDRHDHSRYLIDVAGSVNAYREEHETGWTSHSQLQAVWSQLAVAEGGQFENTQMSEEHKKDFKQLFDKLLDVTFGDKKASENNSKIEEKQKRQKDPGAAIRSLALGVVW